MAAKRFYLQAPVGNLVPRLMPSVGDEPVGFERLDHWQATWLGSGTMALASALEAAMSQRRVANPQVALAAYGCPDLVAAIRFVGAEPYFVDTEPDRPCIDIAELESALESQPNIVAVIGVDLFGIPERWDELRQVVSTRQIPLIQDCAQSVQSVEVMEGNLHGDMVVFSFGRGKPVYLGGGGLLLGSPAFQATISRISGHYETRPAIALGRKAKTRLYNLLIQPQVYAILSKVLGPKLGEVKYVPLQNISLESNAFGALANRAVEAASRDYLDAWRAVDEALQPLIAGHPNLLGSIVDDAAGKVADWHYLRYPLLVKAVSHRDMLIEALNAQGISATRMYRQVLPSIVPPHAGEDSHGSFPRACKFARQLVTLPSHGRLTEVDISAIRDVLADIVSTASR